MTTPLVMANWKMHGSTSQLTDYMSEFLQQGQPKHVDIAFFPTMPYLQAVDVALSGTAIALGAQNVSAHLAGAYTGESAATMLKDVGCQYVMVGHSERRRDFHEDNQLVAEKAQQVVAAGLVPVICIGETLEDRKAERTETIIAEQLDAVLTTVGEGLNNAVLAYEPVWAIGTGVSASQAQITEVHAFLYEKLVNWHKRVAKSIRIVYGGSVKIDNAADIFTIAHVDGALVGGASLNPVDFAQICQAAEKSIP